MRTVYRDYMRARMHRKRKAIIYSTCAGVLAWLLGLNTIHILLICSITWITVWEISTLHVKVLQKIHTLGEPK